MCYARRLRVELRRTDFQIMRFIDDGERTNVTNVKTSLGKFARYPSVFSEQLVVSRRLKFAPGKHRSHSTLIEDKLYRAR